MLMQYFGIAKGKISICQRKQVTVGEQVFTNTF